jgi:hypothetical protein
MVRTGLAGLLALQVSENAGCVTTKKPPTAAALPILPMLDLLPSKATGGGHCFYLSKVQQVR